MLLCWLRKEFHHLATANNVTIFSIKLNKNVPTSKYVLSQTYLIAYWKQNTPTHAARDHPGKLKFLEWMVIWKYQNKTSTYQ